MPDIVIAGAQFNSVPSISIPKAGGGMADFLDTTISADAATAADILSGKKAYVNGSLITGTGSGGGGSSYPWLGNGATKVGTILTNTINLKDDTSYDSWTPSTTSTTIKAASATADLNYELGDDAYDYVLLQRGELDIAYIGTPPTTSTIVKNIVINMRVLFGIHSTGTRLYNGNDEPFPMFTQYYPVFQGIVYRNAGGGLGSIVNGFGPIWLASSPTYTITQTDHKYSLAYYEGQYNARCDNSRFSTASAALVDSENTNWINTIDLYKIPHANSLFGYWESEAMSYLKTP